MELLTTPIGNVYPAHRGHMNIVWYVGKFDEASWNLLAHIGLTPSYLRDQHRGLAAVEQHITYDRELLAGDIISVHSRILAVRDKSLGFVHEMRNAGRMDVAAIREITAMHIDREAKRPCPLPPNIRVAAVPLVEQ